jgi:hypothetical protein
MRVAVIESDKYRFLDAMHRRGIIPPHPRTAAPNRASPPVHRIRPFRDQPISPDSITGHLAIFLVQLDQDRTSAKPLRNKARRSGSHFGPHPMDPAKHQR